MPATIHPFFDLRGKVALITAGGRGMGRASSFALAQAGANVVVSDLDPDAAAAVAAEIDRAGSTAFGLGCDVAQDAELQRLVEATTQRFGRIDIVVCNAGVAAHAGPLASASDAQYARTMDINLRSAWKLTSLVTPGMVARRDGAIVLTSSIAGLRGNKAVGLYSMSTAGLAALARNLAVELGPHNVRANAVSPGMIETEFVRTRHRAARAGRAATGADTVAAFRYERRDRWHRAVPGVAGRRLHDRAEHCRRRRHVGERRLLSAARAGGFPRMVRV